MKKFFLFLTLFVFACSTPPSKGKQIAPPENMLESVQVYVSSQMNSATVQNISVREFPNGVYFVSANIHKFRGNQSVAETKDFIVEKASSASGGQSVWQVSDATAEKLRVLGIKITE